MYTNCQKVQNQPNCCSKSNSPAEGGGEAGTLVGKDNSMVGMSPSPTSATPTTPGRRATIAAAGPSHETRLQQQELQQIFRNSKQESHNLTSVTCNSCAPNCVGTSSASVVKNTPGERYPSQMTNSTTPQVANNASEPTVALDSSSLAATGRLTSNTSITMKNASREAVTKQEEQTSVISATSSGASALPSNANSSSLKLSASSAASSSPPKGSTLSCGGAGSVASGVPRGLSKSPQPQKTPPISMANRGMSSDFSRRPIYPNFPFSPFTSPGTSPYLGRRRQFKESQRVSVEQIGDTLQLNQYKLMHPIGQGSYGIVKLAYNEEDDEFYAMKILSKRKLLQKAGIFGRMAPSRKATTGKTAMENPLTRVYREVAILKKLDHPNVVKLTEVLDDPTEDNLYLVFELLERGEVLEIPTDTPLSEDVAWKYFRDVVLGLEYLHYQKIIHRDIKPSNLLVSDEDRIKIADFGVCNEFNREDDAILTSTTGTPAFVAPEALVVPKGSYSGKMADIWQLGVTLFALVYGQIPFNDGNIMKLYDKIQHEELQLPPTPEVSPLLKEMLTRMLHKDPQKRITLPEIKVHSWVTKNDEFPLLTEEENCLAYVEVTEDDIMNCVRSIPKLDTLILVKTMLKNHSFQNPFKRGHSKGKNPLLVNGRSHSAPSSYNSFFEGKIMSLDSDLPILSESAKESMISPRGSFVNKDPAGRASYRKN